MKGKLNIIILFVTMLVFPAYAFTADPIDSPNNLPEVFSLEGSYLAARVAGGAGDTRYTAYFFGEAQARDPENPVLQRRSLAASLANGDFDRAIINAEQLRVRDPGNWFSTLTLGVNALKEERYHDAMEIFDRRSTNDISRLIAGILYGWAAIGNGDTDGAIERANGLTNASWYEIFREFHIGMMLDSVGEAERASLALEKARSIDGNALRVIEAYTRALARQGERDKAEEIITEYERLVPDHPYVKQTILDLENQPLVSSMIASPQEGAAEILYGIGAALADGERGGNEVSFVYLNLALALAPDHELAVLELAEIFADTEQYDRSIEVYRSLPASALMGHQAGIEAAKIMARNDRDDEAIELLSALVEDDPSDLEAAVALGNVYRGAQKFEEGAKVYTGVIDILEPRGSINWTLYYFRGICFEQTDRWSLAEADFQKALELSPDQPFVLNYLGYSWVDKGLYLEEALDMIELAVEKRPDDGYMVDSLGWAYYRLGNFQEAVRWLEKAVSLLPDESILNDHLGDAYWKVGRKREAVFQWKHARDINPEDDIIDIVLEKLEVGLDVVEARQAEPSDQKTSGG